MMTIGTTAKAAARVSGGEIGNGKGEDGAADGNGGGHQDGADDDIVIGGAQQLGVGFEREFAHDEAGKLVDRVEALQEERGEGAEIDEAEPEERRG